MRIKNFFLKIKPKLNPERTLRYRFVSKVLAPPFVILLIIGGITIWQLNNFVRDRAVNELNRAATSTASKVEREFAIREKILKRTGNEIFFIKSSFQSEFESLEKQRTTCASHVKTGKSFQQAPDNSCAPFLETFATKGASLSSVEAGYQIAVQRQDSDQKDRINERLASFSQFFPETVALVVADKDAKVVSSALSTVFDGSVSQFSHFLQTAKTTPVIAHILFVNDLKLAVFAYPNDGSIVLAAYDLKNYAFLGESWESAPIDQNNSLAIILDGKGNSAYPNAGIDEQFVSVNQNLRNQRFIDYQFYNTQQIASASTVEGSDWLVLVSSPKTSVFAPVRDAQIVAVIIIGLMLVGFLWVGTYFIQKTLKVIMRLVTGAFVFSRGNLDYEITLDKADQEFVSLAGTMNDMAKRIATAEKELDEKNKEFISIATHELRTPLTAIIGNLSMVYEDMADKLDETIKPMIAQAFNGTNKLRELINDLLDVARLEGGRAEFVITSVDAKAVVKEVAENLQVTATEKSIDLSYDETHAQKVMADESRLRIVLNNFISNAIKYNRESGSVKVFHDIKDDKLVIAIKDTGLGIPEDQKAHMFEKFFRVQHEDRKNVIGTGLGMHITKEYVLKMGGDVWFESVHGQGTTFYFSLPIDNQREAKVGSE